MELDTRALTGLRVLLNLWIMIFHSLFVLMYFVTTSEIESLFGRIAIIEHGYIAVDGFFMLTGFLLVLPLLQEQTKLLKNSTVLSSPVASSVTMTSRKRSSSSSSSMSTSATSVATSVVPTSSPGTTVTDSIHRYWKNRFIRVMIPYIFLGILHCLVINRCGVYPQSRIRLIPAKDMFQLFFPNQADVSSGCENVWTNIIHVPFLLPFNGTFMHSWSLGVQYHVWLLFPMVWYHYKLYEKQKLYKFTGYCILFSIIFRGIAQYHSSTPGIEKGSIIGGILDLFWYSSPFARGHIILLGTCIGKYIYDNNYPSQSSTVLTSNANMKSTSSAEKKENNSSKLNGWLFDIGVISIVSLFFLVNVSWLEWTGEDSRYSRNWYHRIFAMFLQVGTPFSGIVWMLIVYSLVVRPGPISQQVSRLFSIEKVWNRLADLSFFAFLLHPMIMTLLYSSPYFLYPPSKVDMDPASDIPWMTESVTKTLQSIPLLPSPVATLLTNSFESFLNFRENFLPSGSSLAYSSMIGILSSVSIIVTYIVSWIGEQVWEKPITNYIFARAKQSEVFAKYLNRTVVAYSWIVIGSGVLLIPLVTTLGYFYITPDVERWIKEHFTNSTNATNIG